MDVMALGHAELAALLAREVDAGVATALAAADASGAFVLDAVVARVRTGAGSGPPSGAGEDTPLWEAEFHLRHTPGELGAAAVRLGVPPAVAALDARSIRGVGAIWQERLADLGVATVGDLASVSPGALRSWPDATTSRVLASRARACSGGWPGVDRADGRSVLSVACGDPGDASAPIGSRDSAAGLWARCVDLLGALDEEVCAALVVSRLH